MEPDFGNSLNNAVITLAWIIFFADVFSSWVKPTILTPDVISFHTVFGGTAYQMILEMNDLLIFIVSPLGPSILHCNNLWENPTRKGACCMVWMQATKCNKPMKWINFCFVSLRRYFLPIDEMRLTLVLSLHLGSALRCCSHTLVIPLVCEATSSFTPIHSL